MGEDLAVARIAVERNCPLKDQVNCFDSVALRQQVSSPRKNDPRPRPQDPLDTFKQFVDNLSFIEVEAFEDWSLNRERRRTLDESEDLSSAVSAFLEVAAHA